MFLLDTNHLSLLERDTADSVALQIRLERVPADQIVTSIVNYEEQMRGWLERAAQANNRERIVLAYARLELHVDTFQGINLLPFDDRAADKFEELQKARVRIGTMDLRIAAIALANNAIVLTRNLSDFRRVPDLNCEDWSL